MNDPKDKLIVALDVETFEEARALIDTLGDTVSIYKVGSQLFTALGPVVIRHLIARGKKVFLDLKFHDIPNTVANAVTSAVALNENLHEIIAKPQETGNNTGSLFMMTVHTVGGSEMLQRASEAAFKKADSIKVVKPLIVGITVLTSDAKTDNIADIVLERARLAKESGLDGVVASSQEASLIRKELGEDFTIVTPGIRPAGAEVGDQKRVTTPKDAVANGSDYLVVGRPIVKAEDPLKAAEQILEEISET
ncbi:MAG: orotidine-5'-phosphate decarboxylase [Candidatus Omnitrophica bacterium]|nr:orotidine-5'-phosphate decarboxylase [Candidatus Omnitrophota bacterium]